MLITANKIIKLLIMCITMSLTFFLLRGLFGEDELILTNLFPYLLSSAIGITLVSLYLYYFPSQKKVKFFSFFIPGMILMLLLIPTGLSQIWLIDELILLLCFIFGGQELIKTKK